MTTRNKYGARKTTVDGVTFDSIAEARRYSELQLLARAGEIDDLQTQPSFLLQRTFKDGQGRTHRSITYIADFAYTDRDGKEIVEDVKGKPTKEWAIKFKLAIHKYPLIEFRTVTA